MPVSRPSQDNTLDEPVKRLSPVSRKRPEHSPSGDPCVRCGYPARRHRKRSRVGHELPKGVGLILGLDGEGQGRDPHEYNLLAAASEAGESWYVARPSLGAAECFEFLLSLPKATIVAFSFSYDITKILTDLPDKKIHKLLHPEERRRIIAGKVRYRMVKYLGYGLNYMNGRLSVHRLTAEGRIADTAVVWDIWRFFQSRFTKALTDWGIATEQQLEWMVSMKAKRGTFETEDPEEVKRYCLDECQKLAQLFRALLAAHSDAGLILKSYFGAGSTSSALLKSMGIGELNREGPKHARRAIASGFFGGWFEDSCIGPVVGPLTDSDISSAYPYHATQLPCLDHGHWSHSAMVSDSDIASATLALVHWVLPYVEPVGAWAPFPVRTKEGSIIHPWSCPGGWVWGQEYLAGKELCAHVSSSEAWLYHTDCDCRPFRALAQYYLERIRVGKTTGPGKVFKLGPNGVYGKLAQTVGHNPPFQSFVLAGVITSNTRAQLIRAILSALDPWAILSVATDGILSRERLQLSRPVDTGTFGVEFPLGGWEQKGEGGRFLVRPGISFPLTGSGWEAHGEVCRPVPDITGSVSGVKARGYGKGNIHQQRDCIVQAWNRGHEWTIIDDGERFGSALSEIHKSIHGYARSESYGQWTPTYTIMRFDPAPKRVRIPGTNRLGLIPHWPTESMPYEPAL